MEWNKIRNEVWSRVDDQLYHQFWFPAWRDIRLKVYERVGTQVIDQINAIINDKIK